MTPVERIDLADGRMPRWVREQHLLRYEWACGMAASRAVLDIACGSGYGSAMLLAAGATSVIGADVDPLAVRLARTRYEVSGLRFEQADATRLAYDDATFDMVVSFETIEHIRDDASYLYEVRRVLRDDGLFLCSTLNRTVMNPKRTINDGSFNQHHVREYDEGEFLELLSGYFSQVQILGQSAYATSYVKTLAHIANVHRMLAVRVHQARKLMSLLTMRRRDRHAVYEPDADGMPEFLVTRCQP